jgi:hypothetical protein
MSDVSDIAEVLPEDDVLFLQDKHPNHLVRIVGGEVHVLLKDFVFPSAYVPNKADVLLRLPAGYPNAAPDMFWTMPDVKLASGAWPQACEHHEVPGSGTGSEIYNSVPWQRWSRHFQEGWIVGRHGLRFYVASINQDLKRGI